MKLPPVVIVSWDDAHVSNDSVDHAPKRQHTAGFLMRDDKAGVSVAAEIGEDPKPTDDVRDVTFIPRGMVVKVRRLR